MLVMYPLNEMHKMWRGFVICTCTCFMFETVHQISMKLGIGGEHNSY
jgi:hypothetical protein